jgi:uncharacterized membrane protein YraQ (UPF0718 family)
MQLRREWKPLAGIFFVFIILYYLPTESLRFQNAIFESLHLAKWYAREHVILCLIPAFFIAGAISVFVSQASVMKYLGAGAKKIVAYGVAAISGCVLAVCSCTVLPLFAGIYRMGAGLGPACAFLYSGPAINVLAIVLTARVLGPELGIARMIGAVVFSIVIGLMMQIIFRHELRKDSDIKAALPDEQPKRPLGQNVIYFSLMVGILLFANWSEDSDSSSIWYGIFENKWIITAGLSAVFALVLIFWIKLSWWKVLLLSVIVAILGILFNDKPVISFAAGAIGLSIITSISKGEGKNWFDSTWDLAKQIFPLLLLGVLMAGMFLGRPGGEGLIPARWISAMVGGNSLGANLFASIVGAFMYFATLTEIPILQGLIGNGMGKGPALALLLAGPALSLPNMLVIRSVMGTKKTVVFVLLVIIMATISGIIFGSIF